MHFSLKYQALAELTVDYISLINTRHWRWSNFWDMSSQLSNYYRKAESRSKPASILMLGHFHCCIKFESVLTHDSSMFHPCCQLGICSVFLKLIQAICTIFWDIIQLLTSRRYERSKLREGT